jgi:hypothetical protein
LKLLNDRKGQVHVIEAFLASMLLLSCLTLIPTQPNLKNTNSTLSSTAENILVSLDCNGHLAQEIEGGNWLRLKNSIESALPLTVWFNLTVFDQNMNCLNTYPICNSGAVSSKIVSYDYLCVSQSGNFAVYTLRLQLSAVD